MIKHLFALTLISLTAAGFWAAGQARLQARPVADAVDTLQVANQLYEEGQFERAIQAYQQLVDQDFSDVALFYNLGNAYFKGGDFGRAILNYRRGERLAPRDPDIKANLKLAQAQAIDQLDPANRENLVAHLGHLTQTWVTFDELAVTALSLWGIVALLLILFTYSKPESRLREGLQYALIVTALLLVIGVFTMGDRLYVESKQPLGVVVAEEVNVTSGPGARYITEFTLHSGTEVGLIERRGNWTHLALPGGELQGWVPARDVEALTNSH